MGLIILYQIITNVINRRAYRNMRPCFRLQTCPSTNSEGFILNIKNEGGNLRLKQIMFGDNSNFELGHIDNVKEHDLGGWAINRNEELQIVCKDHDKSQLRNGEVELSFTGVEGIGYMQKITVSGSNAIMTDSE